MIKATFLNILAPILKSNVKIFIIGFNKTGTTTLHKFFRANRLRSAHFRAGKKIIAAEMSRNVSRERNVLKGIAGYTVYSDLNLLTDDCWLEANSYFREMHAAYPDSYFIFNDREVDNWLRSRMNHDYLIDRAVRYYKTDDREKIAEIWRAQYSSHKEAVKDFFGDKSRFMTFNIEHDKPGKIVHFLAEDFYLDEKKFAWRNKSDSA